ncbi:LuxR C-terminal-related transcriptional regulator [Bosea sp. 685]|uniref:helix-turn-helix transcriptional regulator n=1 Tax=Bosea sp. 685 TaxID=3080057 RepID=UPI002892EF7F|nr:LuxR C-terminal-related transcriptional regulator [Bosea sp. 685]WNJ88625.1 LuxR C-terminal-related transcriptional regulator [Bosea sp. 685]
MAFRSELFSSLVGSLYEAARDPGQWPAAIDGIRVAFGGSEASFDILGEEMALRPYIATARHLPEDELREILIETGDCEAEVAAIDRALSSQMGGPSFSRGGRLLLCRFRITRPAGFLQNDDIAETSASPESQSFCVGVRRGREQPRFSVEDMAWFMRIASHLQRATELSQSVSQARMAASIIGRLPFGVLVVDAQKRVIASNPAATELTRHSWSGIKVRRGILTARNGLDVDKLQHAVSAACQLQERGRAQAGRDAFIHSRSHASDGDALAISICPLPQAERHAAGEGSYAVVFAQKLSLSLPFGFVEQVQSVFGLTPKEAQLACSLAEGFSLKEAAQRQDIRFKTARSYLEEIFQKTGVRQQSQLVAVLKTIQLILGNAAMADHRPSARSGYQIPATDAA